MCNQTRIRLLIWIKNCSLIVLLITIAPLDFINKLAFLSATVSAEVDALPEELIKKAKPESFLV